jgi:phosphohistidine phosphatase SixA
MNLYLLRHAQPEPGNDPDRVLTTNGEKQAGKLGKMFARLKEIDVNGAKILTSDAPRARQTADIINSKIFLTQIPRPLDEFPAPTSGADSYVDELMTRLRTVVAAESSRNIIVVWHHPLVGKALNFLVENNSLAWPEDKFAATAYIECDNSFEQNTGHLRWFILPELLS